MKEGKVATVGHLVSTQHWILPGGAIKHLQAQYPYHKFEMGSSVMIRSGLIKQFQLVSAQTTNHLPLYLVSLSRALLWTSSKCRKQRRDRKQRERVVCGQSQSLDPAYQAESIRKVHSSSELQTLLAQSKLSVIHLDLLSSRQLSKSRQDSI